MSIQKEIWLNDIHETIPTHSASAVEIKNGTYVDGYLDRISTFIPSTDEGLVYIANPVPEKQPTKKNNQNFYGEWVDLKKSMSKNVHPLIPITSNVYESPVPLEKLEPSYKNRLVVLKDAIREVREKITEIVIETIFEYGNKHETADFDELLGELDNKKDAGLNVIMPKKKFKECFSQPEPDAVSTMGHTFFYVEKYNKPLILSWNPDDFWYSVGDVDFLITESSLESGNDKFRIRLNMNFDKLHK